MKRREALAGNARYAASLARALLGAMIFALPLTMTLEMWELGVTMEPFRLGVLLVATLPMLVALSYYAGFEPTFSLKDNILDAFAAMAVSAAACFLVLALFGAISLRMPLEEVAGKLIVLSFAASIGALLADKQFNDRQSQENDRANGGAHREGYGSRLFVMAVGAIFLALNVAPTDEVAIIAASISPWQAALLACVSLGALHAILAVAGGRGEGVASFGAVRRSLAGYGVCLLLCGFILWCFGRADGVAFDETVEGVIVLAFPAALGAGAARLILGGGGGND